MTTCLKYSSLMKPSLRKKDGGPLGAEDTAAALPGGAAFALIPCASVDPRVPPGQARLPGRNPMGDHRCGRQVPSIQDPGRAGRSEVADTIHWRSRPNRIHPIVFARRHLLVLREFRPPTMVRRPRTAVQAPAAPAPMARVAATLATVNLPARSAASWGTSPGASATSWAV